MKTTDISQFKGGCLLDPIDKRDYQALELLAGIDIKVPSFQEGYSAIKRHWPEMPYKNQGSTFSCVGQSWSYYKQVLQFKDTGEKTELSAKSIYNPIAIPGKGSYLRDGGLRTVSYGVNKEGSIYSDRTEEDITAPFKFTKELEEEAAFYKNRITASVNTKKFDEIARMIYLNDGVVSGWGTHAVYFDEYGITSGKRYLKSINSYGPGQELYLFEQDAYKLFSIWTAIDIKNMPTPKGKLRLIRAEGEEVVWFLLNSRRYWVFNPKMMSDGLTEGIWEGFLGVEVLPKHEVYLYPKTDTSIGELWKLYISK